MLLIGPIEMVVPLCATRSHELLYRPDRILRCDRRICPPPKEGHPIATQRAADIDDVLAGFERLMQRLADSHAPEFLEIDVTMPQAKLLYLLGAAGELHMSTSSRASAPRPPR